MKKSPQPKLFLYGIIALIAIGLIIGFFQTYLTKSKAVGETATVSFSPSSGSLPASQAKDITLTIVPGSASTAISGVDLTIKGGGSLSITDVALVSALAEGKTTSANSTELVKTIGAQQSRVSYVFLESNANLPRVITLKVTVQGTAGSGQLSLDTVNSQIVGNIAGNTYEIAGTTQASYTFGGGGGGGGGGGPSVTVSFDPAQIQSQISQPFTTKLVINQAPNGNHISGFDVQIQYDPQSIQIISVSDPVTSGGTTNKFTKIQNDIDATGGKIMLKYVSLLANDQLPGDALVTIRASGLKNATTTFDIASSEVTGDITENSYTVNSSGASITIGSGGGGGNPTPTPTTPGGGGNPTPTPTTGGGGGNGAMTIQMKLKFQGIVKQPASQYNQMRVQVTLGKLGYRSEPSWGNFVSDVNGIWSGSVSFSDIPTGGGYSIYIKGPAHLQKRVCDTDPIDDAPATYRCSNGTINLQAGTNTFDFSGIYLLTGDLPEQDGHQNGVVDAYDLSYVRLSLGARDAKTLSVADLNHDGIVDTQDYSLVIAALNVKYDEL